IFFYDVDAVLDRAGVADFHGDRAVGGSFADGRVIVFYRAAGVRLPAVAGEGRRRRGVDRAERAAGQRADGLGDRARAAKGRLRAVAVALRRRAFSVGDVNAAVRGVEPHGRRIPADRDEAERLGGVAVGDVEDGVVVRVGVGHEEHLAVGRQAEAVGRIAARGA